MKIYILNDTSMAHAGSQQCMKYIYNELEYHDIVGKHDCHEFKLSDGWDDAELVLCNGEGTMHDLVPKAVFLMETIEMAQREGKKTMLVNTVWQNMGGAYFSKVLRSLDYLCVREPMSAKEIGVNCDIIPDFSISAYFESYTGPVDTTLRPRFAKGNTHPDMMYHGIMDHINAKEVSLDGTSMREIIEELKNYDKYITGQYHGMYAAIMAGTPFLMLPSNSWKIESTLQWIGADDPLNFLLDRWKGFSLNEKIPA